MVRFNKLIAIINILFPIIIILIVVVATSMLWPLILGAAWTPASGRVVDKMLKMAEVDSRDVVYDLGSGDGRIVVEAARKYHAKGVGIEVDPLRVLWSRIVILMFRLTDRVRIIWGNIFHQNISEATVVTLFLWQKTNEKLKFKFLEELKPGTLIVSYIWTIKGWDPLKVDKEDRIYLYVVGGDYLEDYNLEDYIEEF